MNRPPFPREQVIDLARYTAGITRSRRAYDLDQANLCVDCADRKRDQHRLRCWTCRKGAAA